MSRTVLAAAAFGVAAAIAPGARAAGVPAADLEEIVITADKHELYGDVDSATQGIVLSEQLVARPILRAGEILEVVPGLIVTQHSGDGKANQYFLRGFNLDHGTDLATRLDGVPVNMPTHAHGQGYSDLNFMIPDLLETVEYKKGPYYAEEGDFSAAGAVDLRYRSRLKDSIVEADAGQHGYQRAFLAQSPDLGGGRCCSTASTSRATTARGICPRTSTRATRSSSTRVATTLRGWSVEASAYDGHWDSTDQIPLRAVDVGAIDRLGLPRSHRRRQLAAQRPELRVARRARQARPAEL